MRILCASMVPPTLRDAASGLIPETGCPFLMSCAVCAIMATPAKKLCFLIGPVGAARSPDRAHADALLKKIIRPTFRAHFRDYKVERSDEISRPGMIDSQVITQMLEADLVIADLTGRNANAYYEPGIRHLHHKPIIHVVKAGEELPFDVAAFRALVFSYDTALDVRDAKAALRKMTREAIKPDHLIENPVTRSAGFVRMRTPEATTKCKEG